VRPLCICVRFDTLFPFIAESRPGATGTDLPKATKLKDVVFRLNSWSVGWVVRELQIITPGNRDLRQITIHMPYGLIPAKALADVRWTVGEAQYGEWSDLDRLLVQLWESHSIHPTVISEKWQDMVDSIGWLLPEITKKGMIDLVTLA
jgi:hypothetical protein